MTKLDIGLYGLTAIALVGVIVLGAMDKTTEIIIPILTALIGAIVGKQGGPLMSKLGIGKK